MHKSTEENVDWQLNLSLIRASYLLPPPTHTNRYTHTSGDPYLLFRNLFSSFNISMLFCLVPF